MPSVQPLTRNQEFPVIIQIYSLWYIIQNAVVYRDPTDNDPWLYQYIILALISNGTDYGRKLWSIAASDNNAEIRYFDFGTEEPL